MSALGASGNGHTETIDGQDYVFSPYTQATHEAFEKWLIKRMTTQAMDTAEEYRRRARRCFREARRIQQEGQDLDGNAITEAERSRIQEEWEDIAGEAQQLEFEAREMVARVNERAAAGYYHFYGPLGRECRGQIHGMEQIFWLSLRVKHPKLSLADVAALGTKPGAWEQMKHGLAMANGELPKNDRPAGASTQSPPATTSESASTHAGGAPTAAT